VIVGTEQAIAFDQRQGHLIEDGTEQRPACACDPSLADVRPALALAQVRSGHPEQLSPARIGAERAGFAEKTSHGQFGDDAAGGERRQQRVQHPGLVVERFELPSRRLPASGRLFDVELRQFPLAALGWVYFKRNDFKNAVDFLTKSADLGPTATNLMHLGMALLESGEKERARQVFRRAKSFKSKGSGLEEKILEQVRTATKLIDRLHQKRRKVAKG
jgi:tetratricopeptide (TPR) repeat protein